MNTTWKFGAAALMIAAAPCFATPAAAAPLSSPLALRAAAAPQVETVQFRRGWRGGYRRGGFGIGAGFVAGAIIGGAIASRPYGYYGYPYGYYAYGPAYAYGPGYYEDDYVAVAPGGDAVAYCQQRFRSYDPRSGTYLGYDGRRHPCP